MPLQATSGAASYDAFGGGVPVEPVYIESIFSTWLYSGTGASQTITNGIDLSTKGGLVWIKGRSGATDHKLTDTARGATKALKSNSFAIETTDTTGLTAFGTTGFTIGADADYNTNAATYASWTFGKQPKFFDVVTYTGDLTSNRAIPHSLGSAPGMIIIKRRDGAITNWKVFHRSNPNDNFVLDDTAGANVGGYAINFGANQPTASNFYVTNNGSTNGSGQTFVAYLFAHDAGGFGLTGTDNVISCGSYTGNGSATGPVVTLGYEPQWILLKQSSASGNEWYLHDSMRGMPVGSADAFLNPNNIAAESTNENLTPLATGFQIATANGLANANGETYIYIAIRRGPMAVPTLGTSVYNAIARTGTGAASTITGVGFPPDLVLYRNRTVPKNTGAADRLRGANLYLATSSTAAEGSIATMVTAFNMDGISVGNEDWINSLSDTFINWFFKRAPSFFDEVCYTGDGAIPRTITHNLTVAPELIITKARSSASFDWMVGCNFGASNYQLMYLNATNAASTITYGNYTGPYTIKPTSTTYGITGDNNAVNQSGTTYVAYLFASAPGVSKVGSYTGNGTTQTIDCGFTGGARFVLIKRTDAAGDWYTYDTARGMTVLTDPYLLLNSTAAESATLGSVTTVSTGFALNSTILAAINVSGGSFVFLAIA